MCSLAGALGTPQCHVWDTKNKASKVMAEMGRKGGKVRGKRRLETMTPDARSEAAAHALVQDSFAEPILRTTSLIGGLNDGGFIRFIRIVSRSQLAASATVNSSQKLIDVCWDYVCPISNRKQQKCLLSNFEHWHRTVRRFVSMVDFSVCRPRFLLALTSEECRVESKLDRSWDRSIFLSQFFRCIKETDRIP